MRALTIRQPWTDLILAGGKDVENRTKPWPSTLDLPCRIGVHASQSYDPHRDIEGWKALGAAWGVGPTGTHFRLIGRVGALLGYVTVTGCHYSDECRQHRGQFEQIVPEVVERIDHCSRWAELDVWHWTLADPVALDEPIPMKGMLGLWRLPEGVAA